MVQHALGLVEAAGADENTLGQVLVFLGTPLVALLVTTLVGMVALGTALGNTRAQVSKLVDSAFAPIASWMRLLQTPPLSGR